MLQAEVQRAMAVGALYPQHQTASGSYTRINSSKNMADPPPVSYFDNWATGLNASWEIDFWGKIRRTIETADDLLAFELVADIKGTGTFRLGETVDARVDSDEWAPIRIRVAGKRSQVRVNNRVASEKVLESEFAAEVFSSSSSQLRNIRIRKLEQDESLCLGFPSRRMYHRRTWNLRLCYTFILGLLGKLGMTRWVLRGSAVVDPAKVPRCKALWRDQLPQIQKLTEYWTSQGTTAFLGVRS